MVAKVTKGTANVGGSYDGQQTPYVMLDIHARGGDGGSGGRGGDGGSGNKGRRGRDASKMSSGGSNAFSWTW